MRSSSFSDLELVVKTLKKMRRQAKRVSELVEED